MTSEQDWANIMSTNLTTSFLITRAAVKAMTKGSPPGGPSHDPAVAAATLLAFRAHIRQYELARMCLHAVSFARV